MKLIDRKELMELLKISRSTIIRLEKKGILKPVKIENSKNILYELADVEELIQASKQSNG